MMMKLKYWEQQYPNRQKVYMEPLPFHGYKARPLQIQIGLGCVLLVLKANVGSDADVLGKFLLFTLFRGAAPSSSEQLRAALSRSEQLRAAPSSSEQLWSPD